MIQIWKKVLALWGFLHTRAFAISALSVVLAFAVFQITTRTNTVYVTDEQGRSLQFTMPNTPETLLPKWNLAKPATIKEPASSHLIQQEHPVLMNTSITVDGKTIPCQVENGTTVGELLYQNGITYDGNDLLSLDENKPIENGDKIVLQRVEYEQFTVEEPIPYETVRKNSSLLRVGSSRRIQEGADGRLVETYVQRTVDGEQEDVQLLGQQVTLQPVTETILIGALTPVSPLDFDLNVDENGRPVEYTRLLQNQVATGYSARPGAKTASGRYAVPGHVAVNPNEIPYGSRMYIVSTDNRFVYGCAIAADTGTGLLQDIVDVDLFYETYQESVLNGRRIVDIYILD